MSSRNEREAVLAILARIREEGTYSHIAVREMLDQCEREGMDRRQRAFVKRLTEGIIERRIEIDNVIRTYTKKGVRIRSGISCGWGSFRSCIWTQCRTRRPAMRLSSSPG